MIRRVLCWLAGRWADTAWLREMRGYEIDANRSAYHHERKASGNWQADVYRGARKEPDHE